jgi:hypothetical protein
MIAWRRSRPRQQNAKWNKKGTERIKSTRLSRLSFLEDNRAFSLRSFLPLLTVIRDAEKRSP